MSFKTLFDTLIIKSSLDKIKKKIFFDENKSELYKLSEQSDKTAHNSYYFSGHGSNGQSLVFRLGENGQSNSEIWFAYNDGVGNDYICAHQIAERDQTMIDVSCVEAGKKWKIQFSGGITSGTKTPLNIWSNPKGIRIIPTVFDGEFTATEKIFSYSKHVDTKPVARAFAQGKWSKSIIEKLFNNGQVYYEQFGRLKGVLNLSGKKVDIDMPAIRSHFYGTKELNLSDRYIRLCTLTDNQTININMMKNQNIKGLQLGYIISNGQFVCLDSCTDLNGFFDDNKVPEKFEILAKFTDGRKLVIKFQKNSVFEFPLDNGTYMICEGIGKFEINGVKARGIIEFGYNPEKNQ